MVHLSSDHRYTFEHVDVNQLIAVAVRRVAACVEAIGLILTQALDETLPPVLLEPDLIAETLVHVLDNAIRYTPNEVTICIMTRRNKDSVVITVTDSGIGIEPQVLPPHIRPVLSPGYSALHTRSGSGTFHNQANRGTSPWPDQYHQRTGSGYNRDHSSALTGIIDCLILIFLFRLEP